MTSTPTIVLLPGLLCDRAVWQAQLPALAAIAPCEVADFSSQDSILAMAEAVLDMTDGPIVPIGHSMGGRVAMQVVQLAPARVMGLGLLDTGATPPHPAETGRRHALVELAYREGMGALADVWLPPMVDPRRSTDAKLLAPMREMVCRATPDQHARQIHALLHRPDARPGLSTIGCPTLVMVGRQDQWSPVAQHEEIAAHVAGARLEIVEDCGHMSSMEQPEATTAILLDFVRSTLARS